jgi:hypothetical protein
MQKNKEAKRFKSKGFVHYNQIAAMMPGHVRGTHAFHPSTQSVGAAANQPASNLPHPAPAVGDIVENPLSNERPAATAQSTSQFTSRSPPSNSNSINSFNSRQSKHKYSAFGDDDDSMSIASGSFTSSQGKHQRGSSTSVLHALGIKMDQMSNRFASSFNSDVNTHVRPDCSPQRRAKASSLLQELEKDLNNVQKVAMIDLFETNMAAADMFLLLDVNDADL